MMLGFHQKNFDDEFKKQFGKVLDPLDFRVIHNHVFGKMIGEDIFVFISYRNLNATERGCKAFIINAGVCTVYGNVDYKIPSCANADLPVFKHYHNCDVTLDDMLINYNQNTMIDKISYALDQTTKFILPELSKITDLNSCIAFYKKYNAGVLYHADELMGESALLIVTQNRDSFEDVIEIITASILKAYNGDSTNKYYIQAVSEAEQRILKELVEARDKVLSNTNLKKALEEKIKERVNHNKIILRKYGFSV